MNPRDEVRHEGAPLIVVKEIYLGIISVQGMKNFGLIWLLFFYSGHIYIVLLYSGWKDSSHVCYSQRKV